MRLILVNARLREHHLKWVMNRVEHSLSRKSVMVLAVAALAVVLGPRALLAQGLVNFANTGTFPTPRDRRVLDLGGTPVVGANHVAALYFGIAGARIDRLAVRSLDDLTVASAVAPFRNVATTSITAGTWIGGTRMLPGVTVGQLLFMEVRVWDFTQFATYEEAMGRAITLSSGPFSYRVPAPTDASGLKIDNFAGMTIIPEPSVSILTAFGAGLLLAWRRKKNGGSGL